jgi:hypothetical protein
MKNCKKCFEREVNNKKIGKEIIKSVNRIVIYLFSMLCGFAIFYFAYFYWIGNNTGAALISCLVAAVISHGLTPSDKIK